MNKYSNWSRLMNGLIFLSVFSVFLFSNNVQADKKENNNCTEQVAALGTGGGQVHV